MADRYAPSRDETDEMHRADISAVRGKLAAKIKDPERRRAYIAKQGEGEKESLLAIGRVGGKDDDIEANTLDDLKKYRKMGSFKKGGMVKKTGTYKLHKGERVLTTKQTKSFKKAK